MSKFFRVLCMIVLAASMASVQCEKNNNPFVDDPADQDLSVIQWAQIRGGAFQMGDPLGIGGEDERPVHAVNLADFFISRCEVTNAQFAEFLNAYGSAWVLDGEFVYQQMIAEDERGIQFNEKWIPAPGLEDHPVVCVSWFGAHEFCRYYNWRLPTEAEWEFAARGGRLSQGFDFSGGNNPKDIAWYLADSDSRTHPIRLKKSNELGLYDMSGNVYEWCQDWYDSEYYQSSPSTNPAGPETGDMRVLRGGSWINSEWRLRTAYRFKSVPWDMTRLIGFRCVR